MVPLLLVVGAVVVAAAGVEEEEEGAGASPVVVGGGASLAVVDGEGARGASLVVDGEGAAETSLVVVGPEGGGWTLVVEDGGRTEFAIRQLQRRPENRSSARRRLIKRQSHVMLLSVDYNLHGICVGAGPWPKKNPPYGEYGDYGATHHSDPNWVNPPPGEGEETWPASPLGRPRGEQ